MTTNLIAHDSDPPEFKNSLEPIEVSLKGINPYIWVRTHEEFRLINEITEIGARLKMDVYCWSLWQGLVPAASYNTGTKATGQFDKTWQPPVALEQIAQLTKKSNSDHKGNIVIMRDVHAVLQEPILRHLKDIWKVLTDRKTKLVFVSSSLGHGAGGAHEGLPPTMEKMITVLDFELPTLNEIDDIVRSFVREFVEYNTPKAENSSPAAIRVRQALENIKNFNSDNYREFARALQGLTQLEVRNALALSMQYLRTINVKFLLNSKKQVLSRSDILEYFEPNRSMSDIGGMDLMKNFFEDYKDCHTQEAQDFGVEPLRGILMVGIPGCGKSQMCKAIASSWKLPLIRLDVGKVMTGLVGGSESKMRSAIQQVEAIAPCILWIDEVEKALSGTKSSNFSDGGTMARVFGTLLTAMEEGLDGVTIVATANDIEALPPEFIRRFSEVFFVDLPGPEEREEIFKIHLSKKRADPKNFDLTQLVDKSNRYTGHEIEKSVARALTLAFKSPNKVLATNHVAQALEETKPISHIMGDKINKMRSEARDKYRYASSWARSQGLAMKTKKESMAAKDIKLPEIVNKNKSTPVIEEGSELELD